MLVLRGEKPSADAPDPDSYWFVRDDPALSGTDIKNPEQNFDQRGGNEPNVTFDFTDKGRKACQDITREIAQRGADNANPLQPGPGVELPALRDRARQRAHLGRRSSTTARTPTASTARPAPQIAGGFTITSAQDLANLLKTGALPLRLELISRSQVSATLGKQALNQGLIAGIAGFADRRALPARLLPRARR